MSQAVLYLALPSLLVFLLLAWHLDSNLGHRKTLLYFGSLFGYGWIRATWLAKIARDDLGSAFPYLIHLPVLKVGGASLQEIIGWGVAVTLAWWIADRILQRIHIAAGPYRVAALGAFILCTVCFAVETAAIESGWWQWTLNQQARPFFGRVPLVGLLDWAFVAFDFLLPFLVFAAPAPWAQRIPACFLFLLHFRFHAELKSLPEPLVLTPNDLMHAAIFAFVLIVAAGERGPSALPRPDQERYRWLPVLSAGIVSLATALSCVFVAGAPLSALASVPLLLAGLAAGAARFPAQTIQPAPEAAKKSERKEGARGKAPAAKVQRPRESWKLFLLRIGIAAGVCVLLCVLRIPFNRRTNEFVSRIQAAVSLMNGERWSDAEAALRQAIAVRPEHPAGHVMLGQVLLIQKKDAEARAELQQALSLNATDLSALSLLCTLEIRTARLKEAADVAATGIRIYPDHMEFRYLAALAEAGGVQAAASDTVQNVIRQARSGDPRNLQAIYLAALNLNDTITIQELQRR